jgi:hypothetical protein
MYMPGQTSSIDEMLLTGTAASTPPTSESKDNYEAPNDAPENDLEIPDKPDNDDFYATPEEKSKKLDEPDEEEEAPEKPESRKKEEGEVDDYGNPKAPPKTYTEDEVNEMFRKRFKNKPTDAPVQQQPMPQPQTSPQTQDFEYNPDSDESWQAQLEKFVENTVSKLGQKKADQQQRELDNQMQAEFEDKFSRSMGRFGDFREVVGAQPITDPMTYALREMTDPAAFLYAASKRHPEELQRISGLPSRNAQMIEMGKLEERMRKVAAGTKAPKPVSKSRDDGGMPMSAKKTEPSVDDLIAKSDAKRRAQLEAKRRR